MRSLSLLPSRSGFSLRRRKDAERPPLSYALGLLGVASATVLLPAVYVALCGLLVWALRLHLLADLGWIVGPRAGLLLGCAYVGVAFLLIILTAFMLRPLLAARRRRNADIPLRPEAEPRLHAFVQQICSALGSPAPIRILVNMDVNASARFAPGWTHYWNGNLELVLGLPLVRGLELGQFAAVLAHELGHFRQGVGMRLVHGIRAVNAWFSRAAMREDAWEKDFKARGKNMDPFLYGLCWLARLCARFARSLLRLHVRAGQAVSCLLLRQMEHEADGQAVRLVGGETFSGMVLEAKVIEAAWGLANRSLGLALREGRLADDLPALVSAHTRVFIPEVRRKMERSILGEKTAWFDTHPSLAERVQRARKAAVRGVFHSGGMAHALFTDFQSLSRRATVAFYHLDLGGEFNPNRMMSTTDLVTGQSEVQVGEAAVTGYFLGLLTNLRPLWLNAAELKPDAAGAAPDGGGLRAQLRLARERIESEHARAAELYRAYTSADARMLDAVQALSLMKAKFWIEPGDFQLRKGGALQAAQAFRDSESEQRNLSEGLTAFESAMRRRMTAALRLLDDAEVRERLLDARACSHEVTRLLPVLSALASVQPRLESLRRSFHGMGILLENRAGNEGSAELETQLKTHALALRLDLEAVGAGLSVCEYPFGSGTSAVTVAEYALDALPRERDYQGHYLAGEEVLGRCYALYFRVFGRLALAAGRVEGVLGLGPLQVNG